MEAPNPQIRILDTIEDIKQFYVHSRDPFFKYLSFDVETNGTQVKQSSIYGIGLCFDEMEAFYIPFKTPTDMDYWTPGELKFITKGLVTLFSNKRLIAHNGVFDILILENQLGIFGLDKLLYADTILMKHMIDEERPFGLKECAIKYLGEWAGEARNDLQTNVKTKGGRWTNDEKDMYLADTAILGKYCCYDVVLTYLLFQFFEPKIRQEGLWDLFYKDEVMPLYKEVTINMKRQGFPVDVPYFQKLLNDITIDINIIENEINNEIKDLVVDFEIKKLEEEFPARRTGHFPKALAKTIEYPNDYSSQKTMAKDTTKQEHIDFNTWVTTKPYPESELLHSYFSSTRKLLWKNKYGDEPIFNLSSNDHLAWLFFDKLEMEIAAETKTGKPKLDADTLEELAGQHKFADKIIEYKKLQKLKSTYIETVLEKHINGRLYVDMLQFGTTSGRYSSKNINLQNQPRAREEETTKFSAKVLEYFNNIRKGFIAGVGKKIIDSDYSQLEPRCFAAASGDKKLQSIFHDKADFYSGIAKNTFEDCSTYSADKKAENYLGKMKPEKRQIAKVIALAIPYGAQAGQIARTLDIAKKDAQDIITDYLTSYPELAQYIKNQEIIAVTKGEVKTQFGRVRHLSKAKELYRAYGYDLLNYGFVNKYRLHDQKKKFKNQLNLAKNFPIQGIAAHITNRAMLRIKRMFDKENINGYVALMVHDQIICIVDSEQAEKAVVIVRDAMENTTKISVPLIAEPKIANNLKDSH